jgi:dsDNA-specific endonuclease/ATPase MutS2
VTENHRVEDQDHISLTDLPGVGVKTAERIINHYGSEEFALQAIEDADLAGLCQIEGIGERFALGLIHNLSARRLGASIHDVLATQDSIDIYNRLISMLGQYAMTSFTRNQLLLYYPLSKKFRSEIDRRVNFFSQAKGVVEGLGADLQRILTHLAKLRPLRFESPSQQVRGRIILTEDQRVYTQIKNDPMYSIIEIRLVESPQEVKDYADGYDMVIWISAAGPMELPDNAEVFPPGVDPARVLPEATLHFYSSNLDVIKATCELAHLTNKLPSCPAIHEILGMVDAERLSNVLELITGISEAGGIIEGHDLELDRLRNARANLAAVVGDAETWANSELTNRISSSSLQFSGQQILDVLKMGGEGMFQQYLDESILEYIEGIAHDAEDQVAQQLGLQGNELEHIEGLFPRTVQYPIEASDQNRRRLEGKLSQKFATNEFKLATDLAGQLADYIQEISTSVRAFLDLDLFLSVGRFSKQFNLNPPKTVEDRLCISFSEGKNLYLLQEELNKNLTVAPVTYALGDSSFRPEGTNGERVVILSGANSGGKTTAIQLIAQLAILAQCGFPVPATGIELAIFDNILYFSKPSGTMDAGAFESTLRMLSQIVTSEKEKLVLVDELEAISEPGASARVIAAILDMFNESKTTCGVFVTHLAGEISKFTQSAIRIDGIEARGLDQDLNLVVDRSPQFGLLARSTPELIVERLYRLETSEMKKVYREILERFNSE